MNLESPDLFSGITHNGGKEFLPLTNLDVQALIVDTSSRVTLSQTYFYEDSVILHDAFYIFPIPSGAVLCGFEMRANDEVHMEGIVKKIDEAEKDFRRIFGDNDIANLIEQSLCDTLVLFLGSFLPRTTITISITYVVDLFDSTEPIVKFRIPSYVSRSFPKIAASRSSIPMTSTLNINLDIEMPGEVLYVYSNLPLQDVPIPSSTKNGNCIARKHFTSTNMTLDNDFLLSIQALGLDQSRCFLEQSQDSAALSLNIVPSSDSDQDIEKCEYIFLVDRSWSMCVDDKMEETKRAMTLVLKTLPVENTWFNIYSFEHSHDSLWPQSRPYHQIALGEALNFISHLDPRGGTELFSVFQTALFNRRVDVTTKIFMLTDGEVHYPQRTIDLVTAAVQGADPTHPIKVFTLAIGSAASDLLCEGLAPAGNGLCLKTLDGEKLTGKCTNMLNRMMLRDIHELRINWNVNGTVHQAPIDLTRCSKGCLSVKAIIPRGDIPETVSILGKTSDDAQIRYDIPVLTAQTLLPPTPYNPVVRTTYPRPLFHTIAANSLSQDLERVGATNYGPNSPDWSSLPIQLSKIKEELLNLGIQYNILNSMTTFIAIDIHGEQGPNYPKAANFLTPTINSNNENLPPTDLPELDGRPSSPASNENTDSSQSSGSSSADEAQSRPLTPFSSPGCPDMPGAFSRPKAFIIQTESVPEDEPDEKYVFPSVPPTHVTAPPLQHERILVSYSNPIRMFVHRPWSNRRTKPDCYNWPDILPEDTTFDQKFTEWTDMQWYDGSFPDVHQLSYIIGYRYDEDIPLYCTSLAIPSSVDYESVWATALAVRYLRKQYPHRWIVWKDLARKSITWGRKACGSLSTFDRLVTDLLPL